MTIDTRFASELRVPGFRCIACAKANTANRPGVRCHACYMLYTTARQERRRKMDVMANRRVMARTRRRAKKRAAELAKRRAVREAERNAPVCAYDMILRRYEQLTGTDSKTWKILDKRWDSVCKLTRQHLGISREAPRSIANMGNRGIFKRRSRQEAA